jgi:hypothetical protein
VILNGWKEIASYLHSGIRTVQRWERFGLPVGRVGPGHRSPVVTLTQNVDGWVRGRLKDQGLIGLDMETTLNGNTAARARVMDELRVLQQNELLLGTAMADSASRTKDVKEVERRTAMARQAYDTIVRLSRSKAVSNIQSKQFKRDLGRLKNILRKLGEEF